MSCGGCSEFMPAGRGKRCEQCESKERFARNASQLAELISGARARLAFGQYTEWLSGEAALKATVRRLPEHVQFFEALDKAGDEPWTGEFLLRHFGTAQLRRFELPVRWLEQQRGVVLCAEDKKTEAESRRAAAAVDGVPQGTLARTLIDEFSSALSSRVSNGDLSPRSMRMALRPAIALLANEDPTGARVPGQKALDRYLERVPGQRAAISTFIGFLKANHGAELKLPAKPRPGGATVRKQLEKQIVALVTRPDEATRLTERWLPLGLRYFHHLSAAQAKSICQAAEVRYDQDGVHVVFEGQTYWLPARPTIHGGLVGRVGV